MKQELVPEEAIQINEVEVRCVHGDVTRYPLAVLTIGAAGREFEVRARVTDKLPVPVLLGTDVPDLMTLIREPMEAEDVLAVTRAQGKQQAGEENMRQQKEKAAAVKAKPLEDPPADVDDHYTTYDFHDDVFQGGKGKPHLTRSQRRASNSSRVLTQQRHQLDITTEQLTEAQKEDSSLDTIRQAAEGKTQAPGPDSTSRTACSTDHGRPGEATGCQWSSWCCRRGSVSRYWN